MKDITPYFLVFFSIVFSIYSFIILLSKKNNFRLKNLLIFLLIIISIVISVAIVDLNKLSENLKNVFSLLFYILIISVPPLLYIYNSSISESQPKPNYKTLNISFGLGIVNLISYFYLSNNTLKGFFYIAIENVMSYSNLIAYLFLFPILSIHYIIKSFKIKDVKSKYTINSITIGYIFLFGLLFIYQAGLIIEIIKPLFYLYIIFYIIWAFYLGIKFDKKQQIEKEVNDYSDKLNENTQFKYFEEINSKLEQMMINQKPYLDSKLTIYQLAKLLDTNDKYLSMYINLKLDTNFSSFINTYRIEEAKSMLASTDSKNYTLETIGNMAGFHSKSSFNSAFKKSTGMTPSEYFKSISQK